MANKKTTKRALLLSALSLLMCVSMLIGSTFAWFTDSVTSTGNIIKSGNLDVEMYWADGTNAVPDDDSSDWTDASTGAIFNNDLWEPGYIEVRHIKIANEGTLALKYKVSIIANGEVSALSDVIDVYYVDPAVQVADRTALTEANKLGTLTQVLENLGVSGNGTLAAGATDTITIALKMQESAGNEYQGKSIGTTFAIQLLATQLTYESDSFNDQYDKDSEYLNISVPVDVPTDAAQPMALSVNGMDVNVPVSAVPAGVTTISLAYTNPVIDAADNTITYESIEIVDQNGNAIDLEEAGNTENLTVTLPAQATFAAGERVYIYHDGEYIATAIVNADGTIAYEAAHFCEVVISDKRIAKIHSAEEFIAVLTEIKTEAKRQIPGETGNKAYRENAMFILENDIVIDADTEFMYTDSNGAPLHFYGVRGVLDLNGHNITVSSDALLAGKTFANAVLLIQYSDIDIVGEGSIIANNQSIPVYGWANATVNIYGGNYVTNASERNESAVYVNNASVLINVYGGNYAESAYAFNVHDNCKNTTVIVLQEGVSYKQFLKNGTTDVITSDLNAGRIQFADGCALEETVIDDEVWYQVVKG